MFYWIVIVKLNDKSNQQLNLNENILIYSMVKVTPLVLKVVRLMGEYLNVCEQFSQDTIYWQCVLHSLFYQWSIARFVMRFIWFVKKPAAKRSSRFWVVMTWASRYTRFNKNVSVIAVESLQYCFPRDWDMIKSMQEKKGIVPSEP